MNEYEDLFQLRGSAYDRAMRDYPKARREEFGQAIVRAQLRPGMVVLDAPAGGGYLSNWLPEGCIYKGHEPCGAFNHHGGAGLADQVSLLPLPFGSQQADVVISLAGVHHLAEKRPLFSEFLRVLKPGGRLVVSDVREASSVARFLDEFVGAFNSTGHEGIYLNDGTLSDLTSVGWQIERSEVIQFHWLFDSKMDMGHFCHGLFDLQSCEVVDTIAAITHYLGAAPHPSGGFSMRLELMTITATR